MTIHDAHQRQRAAAAILSALAVAAQVTQGDGPHTEQELFQDLVDMAIGLGIPAADILAGGALMTAEMGVVVVVATERLN